MHEVQTVLVIDDDKASRAVMAEILKSEARVVLAKNGQMGLELATKHIPDLILLDVVMPDMDGYAVLRALREQYPAIPVIFISGLDSIADEEKGLLLGAADYISKPFHAAIVRARVRNHLAMVRQWRMLENQAMLDPLTGIPNRRRFEQALGREWPRGMPLSLVMIDVDHFKPYNDNYGHPAGDGVLREIATTLHERLQRQGDLLARYGGEEFVILLPGTQATDGCAFAEQLHASIAELAIEHQYSSVAKHVTLSMGGATLFAGAGQSDVSLLQLADTQLYRAKTGGRNQVMWLD